jgi:hypothetical protein
MNKSQLITKKLIKKRTNVIDKEITKRGDTYYDFNFWNEVLSKIGCYQISNTTIVVYPEDINENRFFIESDLDSMQFVIIGKDLKIFSKNYKFDQVFDIIYYFQEYQKIYLKLLELKNE